MKFFLVPREFLPWRKFTRNKEEINWEQGENLSQTRNIFFAKQGVFFEMEGITKNRVI